MIKKELDLYFQIDKELIALVKIFEKIKGKLTTEHLKKLHSLKIGSTAGATLPIP